MLGIVPFIFEVATTFFPPLLAIKLFFAWRMTPKNLQALVVFGMFTGMSILITFFMLPHLISKCNNFIFLRTVQSSDVISIKIDNTNLTDNHDIKIVTDALNRSVWRMANHNIGGPFVDMTMMLRSGSIMVFRVGRYNDENAAVIDTVGVVNGSISSVESYMPKFPSELEKLKYSLPPAILGYTSGVTDYLSILGFTVMYVVLLWPQKFSSKKRSRSV
jgi:hypothetical protein